MLLLLDINLNSEADVITYGADIATRPHIELLALALGVHELSFDTLSELLRVLDLHALHRRKVLCLAALKVQLLHYFVKGIAQLHLVMNTSL